MQQGVSGVVGVHALHNAVAAKVDVLEGVCAQGLVCADSVVTGAAVTGAQLDGVEKGLCELHEGFVANLPCKGTGGEDAPLAAFAEVGGAVKTHAGVEDVLVKEHIFGPAEEGDVGLFRLCRGNPFLDIGGSHIVI